MQNYEREVDLPNSQVYVKLRYNGNYTISEKDRHRWYRAWSFLGREDAVPNPGLVSTGKPVKIPIKPDEYSEKKQLEIQKQFSNLEFECDAYF